MDTVGLAAFRKASGAGNKKAGPASCRATRSARSASRFVGTPGATRKAMVVDVVLVLFWGASIPGLMWLGAAGGF